MLLYQMLTGTTPFSNDELNSASFEGMMKLIREVEPHKPSTRLSSMGDSAAQAAVRRRADIQKLGTLLRGDRDWILMKCLETVIPPARTLTAPCSRTLAPMVRSS